MKKRILYFLGIMLGLFLFVQSWGFDPPSLDVIQMIFSVFFTGYCIYKVFVPEEKER